MKNKGFTLIELLAVIVILAIIALIATPIVLNIINNVKSESDKRSIDLYGHAIELAIARKNLTEEVPKGSYKANKNTLTLNDSDFSFNVDYDGDNIECDITRIHSDGTIFLDDCKINDKNIEYSYGAGYTELEYLESTGTQWIDTGINAETGISCELKASYNKVVGNATLLGASIHTTESYLYGTKRFYLVNIDNQNLEWTMGYGNFYTSNGKKVQANTIYQINVDLLKDRQSVTIDGEVVISQNLELEINLKENLYLFALNLDGAAANYGTGKRVYNLKLYDNDILVRDFIPVLDKDDIPCMYDKVDGKFYYNQGTKDFLYG